MALINVNLKPWQECQFPSAQIGKDAKSVSWFWLTDSEFYLSLGGEKLYEVTQEWQALYPGSQFNDYYFVRFLEDFFDILPQIRCSISDDMWMKFENIDHFMAYGIEMNNFILSDEFEELPRGEREWHEQKNSAFWHHHLDSGYLQSSPAIVFLRHGEEIRILWDFTNSGTQSVPLWSAGTGCVVISWQDFIGEIREMLARFFEMMDFTVAAVAKYFAENPDQKQFVLYENGRVISLGNSSGMNAIELLWAEHQNRKQTFYQILTQCE